VALQRALAALEHYDRRPDLARRRLLAARDMADAMVAHEPDNERWADLRRKIRDNLVLLEQMQKETRQ
jgi:hypothetical protein